MKIIQIFLTPNTLKTLHLPNSKSDTLSAEKLAPLDGRCLRLPVLQLMLVLQTPKPIQPSTLMLYSWLPAKKGNCTFVQFSDGTIFVNKKF